MTESSTSQAVATQAALPVQAAKSGMPLGGNNLDRLRFSDLLKESRTPIVPSESGLASPEQMFESNVQKTRVGRTAKLRDEYHEAIDRQSAVRAESRTSVKARRSALPQETAASDTPMPQPPRDLADRAPASGPQESGVPMSPTPNGSAEPPSPAVEKTATIQRSFMPEKQGDGRAATVEHDSKAAPPSTANIPARPTGAAPTPEASNPQVARELGRLLATPQTVGGEVRSAPTENVIAGNSVQGSGQEAKTTKNAAPTKDTSQPSTAQAKAAESPSASEFERLIRLARASSGRQSSTRVLLDPPELGKVHVRVMVENGRIDVDVDTENDSARQLISDRAQKLKTALEQQGLVVDRFDVTTNQGGLFNPTWAPGQETFRPQDNQNRQSGGRAIASRPGRWQVAIKPSQACTVPAGGRRVTGTWTFTFSQSEQEYVNDISGEFAYAFCGRPGFSG